VEKEVRPADGDYYEVRQDLLSQGDIFGDVPLAFPLPAGEIVEEEASGPGRKFLSGPFEPGMAMLLTPTCSMRSQDNPTQYAHPVRTLVPVMPLTDGIIADIGLDPSKIGLIRKYDQLINFMYLPASREVGIEESIALLYFPVTLHHDIIDGQRVTQLAVEGARQLHRKIVWLYSGLLESRQAYDPPLD
jgi:hypothetical protein